jgi:hypothetical protein
MTATKSARPDRWRAWRTKKARRVQRVIILISLVGLGYAGYQIFGPTPYHAYWKFAHAMAAGDREAMYRMQSPMWPGQWGVPTSYKAFDRMMTHMEPIIPHRLKVRRIDRRDGLNCPNVTYEVKIAGRHPVTWPARAAEGWPPGISLWLTADGWKVDIYNSFWTILKSQAGEEAAQKWGATYQRFATPPEDSKGWRERYREAEQAREAEGQDREPATPADGNASR